MRAKLDKEVREVMERGLEIVTVKDASWVVRLNEFPDVTQGCRASHWRVGNDLRLRPKPGEHVYADLYQGKPRVRARTKDTKAPVLHSIPKGTRRSPQPTAGQEALPFVPPPPDQRLDEWMARIEAKVDIILRILGGEAAVS